MITIIDFCTESTWGQVSTSSTNWEEVTEGHTFLTSNHFLPKGVMQCKQKVQEANDNKSKMKSSLGEWENGDSPETSWRRADAIKHQSALEPPWQQGKESSVVPLT